MVEEITLCEHLHKLDGVKSEQEVENLLQLLWQTRKTGLSASQRSSLQSLLKLPSPGDLDPVSYCRTLAVNFSFLLLFSPIIVCYSVSGFVHRGRTNGGFWSELGCCLQLDHGI